MFVRTRWVGDRIGPLGAAIGKRLDRWRGFRTERSAAVRQRGGLVLRRMPELRPQSSSAREGRFNVKSRLERWMVTAGAFALVATAGGTAGWAAGGVAAATP